MQNINKNTVAERALEELALEVLHLWPHGGPVFQVTLSLAVANMNCMIRGKILSACEIWTQRDQVKGQQLPFDDRCLVLAQVRSCQDNHAHSVQLKAPGRRPPPVWCFA